MSAIKIVFKTSEKQVVLYAQNMKQMWQVESHVLERLGEVERKALTNATFRKYWIDEERDCVEILNDADFEYFVKNCGGRTPKIYFEAVSGQHWSVPREEPQSTSSNTLEVHSTVECDSCFTAPIRGFRYKCMQCPNFDLCMQCESEMKHPEHLMMRIPNENATRGFPCSGGRSARRQQKHAARAAAAANSAALGNYGSTCEAKSRHHRHGRNHVSGILSNFYGMMTDLAEGGVSHENPETPINVNQQGETSSAGPTTAPPQSGCNIEDVIKSAAATACAAASTAAEAASIAAASGVSKETNTSPNRSSFSSAGTNTPPINRGVPVTPSLENIMNPEFMKTGIQILNNFSEMFGKMLDPAVSEGASRPSSAPESVINIDIDLTGDNGAAATTTTTTPPPTTTETPMETDSVNNSEAGVAQPQPTPRKPSEDNGWTIIDENYVPTSDEPSVRAPAAATPVASAPPVDFIKLSQQLQSHIENEIKSGSNPGVHVISTPAQEAAHVAAHDAAHAAVQAAARAAAKTAAEAAACAADLRASTQPAKQAATPRTVAPVAVPTTSSAPTPTPVAAPERRAVAVFHPNPRINQAVHGMMAMGFSNEGAVLTQLLESVNGDIPLALDLMSSAQRD